MSEKPQTLFIATNASFPGYWGSSKDGIRQAIATCRDAGAGAGDIFVVYEAYEGCSMNDFGGISFLVEHGEPEVEGVYDATGEWLGENLLDVAERCQSQDWWAGEHPVLSSDTLSSLKRHKKAA